MNENNKIQTPEFSHPITVENIPNKGVRVKLEPNLEELTLLMNRFDLLGLVNMKAALHVKPLSGGHKIRIIGTVQADVVQACIVNLSPVSSQINEEFEIDFSPEAYIEHDVEMSLADDDACEPIEDGVLDLGEIVAQQLALLINPYPRSETADLDSVREDTKGKNGPKFEVNDKPNPFAVLKGLKEKD